MSVVHTFKAEKSHERFRLTASTVETGAGQWVHVVVEDTEFGPRLGRILLWLLGLIAVGTLLAFALPALATL